jgi:hypothetical protein
MPITKKNKKILGGAVLPQRTALIKSPDSINTDFANSFKYYFDTLKVRTNYIFTEYVDDLLFIGLIENDIIFGTTVKQIDDGLVKQLNLITVLYIKLTDDNVKLVNQFKLYIMSIMANYPIQKDSNIYKQIKPLLNPLKMPEIMKILDIKPDVPVCKPPPALPPPPPKVNDEIMFELQIYKEFGIKCSGGKECYNEITDNFYKFNEGEIPNLKSSNNELIRNIYVNIFDYITGSEVPTIGSKDYAYTTCITKTHKSITDLNEKLKKDEFIGARTRSYFNISKLVKHINIIRIEVNKSVKIDIKQYIPEI